MKLITGLSWRLFWVSLILEYIIEHCLIAKLWITLKGEKNSGKLYSALVWHFKINFHLIFCEEGGTSGACVWEQEVISWNMWFKNIFDPFLACLGGSERPCHGNGHCDGDGTRGGDGSCSCKKEYTGQFCLDCSSGYFSSLRNETHSVCTGKKVLRHVYIFVLLLLCVTFFASKTRNNWN